jgi:ADP-ribose pyrophosphatase YjhB (NUDIX family)
LGDIGLRFVCRSCGAVHYQRHSLVAGSLAIWENQVLLVRRAIEPSRNLWTLPAGYVELGETLEEAALRETREEAGANAQHPRLFALYNLPMFGEVYVLFFAELRNAVLAPGPESYEARLFSADDIPWQELAFAPIREALRAWSALRGAPPQSIFTADFFWGPEGAVRVRRSLRPEGTLTPS